MPAAQMSSGLNSGKSSIREPNKSASSTGVGMYSKDYTSHGRNAAHPQPAPSNSSSTNNEGAQTKPGTTLNKSMENVIRKAAYRGIEPLRRRYTGNAGANSHSSSLTHSSYTQAARSKQATLNDRVGGNIGSRRGTAASREHDSNQH